MPRPGRPPAALNQALSRNTGADAEDSPGPDPKPIALTGGTGGEGTLVEFGDETGSLTLKVLFLDTRRGDG